ncbi:hypothetical protein [Streptomyces avicenniae]|uniref:hypothetical protein n=1 Tax=Streptomyces avicenniae TaxID=500153 RepID=UPI00069BE80B|nr:hypothetical protein [Streptomyces avicenniae]
MAIEFIASGFQDISSQTTAQREEVERIWNEVRNGIQSIAANEAVQEQVSARLAIRDAEFRQKVGVHDESVGNMHTGMNRVATMAGERAERMARVAGGGA